MKNNLTKEELKLLKKEVEELKKYKLKEEERLKNAVPPGIEGLLKSISESSVGGFDFGLGGQRYTPDQASQQRNAANSQQIFNEIVNLMNETYKKLNKKPNGVDRAIKRLKNGTDD